MESEGVTLQQLLEQNQRLLAEQESLRQQNSALATEVRELTIQAQRFERRLAALEGGGASLPEQPLQSGVLEAAVQSDACKNPISTDAPTSAQPTQDSTGAVSPAPSVSQAPSDDASWAINAERLDMYRRAFLKADRNADGFCEMSEVKEVLDRAGLPHADDARSIWILVDITQRRRLNFAEFACAMFIAFRRAKGGVPLPAELPKQLLEIASSDISIAAPDEMPSTSQAVGQQVSQPLASQQQLGQHDTSTGMAGYPLHEDAVNAQTAHTRQDPLEACVAPSQPPTMVTASAPTTAIPAFFETGSAAAADPFDQAMSVKELKARLRQLGADFTGLAEKSDLLALLHRVEAAKKDMPWSQASDHDPLPAAAVTTSCPTTNVKPSEDKELPAKSSDDPFAGLI